MPTKRSKLSMMNLSASSRIGLAVTSACLAAGCMALAAAPELGDVSSLGASSGGAFSGFAGTQSTVAVNKSWIHFNDLAERNIRVQMAVTRAQRRQQALARDTALGILKDIDDAEGGNPAIANLITWVKAGGDPQTALTYALNSQAQQRKDVALRQTTVGLLRGMEDEPQADPPPPMLISWVRAGGDPQHALNYALTHHTPPSGSPGAQAPAPAPRRQSISIR